MMVAIFTVVAVVFLVFTVGAAGQDSEDKAVAIGFLVGLVSLAAAFFAGRYS
jgi:hypothetical protein